MRSAVVHMLILCLALVGMAAGQPGTGPEVPPPGQGVDWPAVACEERVTPAGGWSNHRPRQLDEVGEALPAALLMPVEGQLVADVYPSFGDPRSGGRLHLGIDIMAPRGTPVRPAAPGYVVRMTDADRGGISVTLVGDGGVRYFYTHFDSLPGSLQLGQWADLESVIGYVGNTGNAANTAPHLHFEVHVGGVGEWCGFSPVDPLPLLQDR